MNKIEEFIKTLEPIIDWSTVKKDDKIFNRCSLSVDYIDTFKRVEEWSNNRLIVFYKNHKGETWTGDAVGYWYYIK